MSKTQEKEKYELTAAARVRTTSLLQLKKDFKSQLPKYENHDLRVYYDGNNEYYPWVFSKTLTHSAQGFPLKSEVDKIIEAWKYGDDEHYDEVKQSAVNQRKLEGVACSLSFNLVGTDSSVPRVAPIHPVDSEENIFEMAEVYAMALLRDETFIDLEEGHSSAANTLLGHLNNFPNKTTAPLVMGNITAKSLLRGGGVDESEGPYISQLLYLPFKYGNLNVDQKFVVENDFNDSLDPVEWKSIQEGKVNGVVSTSPAKYMYTPRVLGSAVHKDPLYQFYYNATLVLFQNGIGPQGWTPTNASASSAWTSAGPPDVLSSVAHVSLGALRVAWANKWGNMKIRPEVCAQRIELSLNPSLDITRVPGLGALASLSSTAHMTSILTLVKNDNKNINTSYDNVLLKLQYPEGSPTHPTCPAGHAVVSGAGVTVLKAMLDTHAGNVKKPWPSLVKHSVDGDSLIDYTGDTSGMTIVGELNKLASNIALGRDWAGVHYRCDGDCGVKLGELYAITYLIDKAKEYHESQTGLFTGFTLEKFDGSLVLITHTGVTPIP